MNGNAVRVVLWGETVGYLTWDSGNCIQFCKGFS